VISVSGSHRVVAGTAAEKYKEPLIHQPSGDCSTLLLFAAESIGRNTFDKMQLLGTYLLWREEKEDAALLQLNADLHKSSPRVRESELHQRKQKGSCVSRPAVLLPRARAASFDICKKS
jgi:hypothetical protein